MTDSFRDGPATPLFRDAAALGYPSAPERSGAPGPAFPGGRSASHRPVFAMTAPKKNSRYLPDHADFRYEEFPFYWLARVHAIYVQEMEKVLKKLGTDVPTRRVLLMLRLHGTVSVSELATHSIIKLSTLTRIIQRMRDEGLVDTRTNAEDARITDVLVTPKGDELTDRIQDATQKIYVRGYAGLSDSQLTRLMETLQVMFRNLSED